MQESGRKRMPSFAAAFNTDNRPWQPRSPVLQERDWGDSKLPADPKLVSDLLLLLDAQKSTGPDGIHPRGQKEQAHTSWDLSLVFFSSPGSLERSWSTGSWQVLSQKVSQQCALAAKGATRVLGRSKPSTARRSREVTAPHWAARAQPHLKPCVLSWAPQHKEAIKQFARGQRKVPQMVKGLEGKAEEERLRSLALLSVEKRRLRGELSAAYSFLQGGSGGRGADLLPPVTSDRTRGKGMKLPRGTFSWDIRKRFVTEGMLGHRNGLSREAVPAPSLSEFKERLGHALSHMV